MHSALVDALKQAAAEQAVQLVQDRMVVGLGSGSTAAFAVEAIGKRVREGLRMIGIPTSKQTAERARQLKIPLSTLDEHHKVDLTIDGADEVETGTLTLIKGGGGHPLREKIVAAVSSRLVIIIDSSKLVQQIGLRHAVPVEVIRFGWETTARRLKELRIEPILRLQSNGTPFLTDDDNYILDCNFGAVADARRLREEMDGIVGVVEHGLFVDMAELVIVGSVDGVTTLHRKR